MAHGKLKGLVASAELGHRDQRRQQLEQIVAINMAAQAAESRE